MAQESSTQAPGPQSEEASDFAARAAIVIEFLEPIPPGLDRKTFMRRLEQAIEPATAALVAEARAHEAGQGGGRSV